MSRDVNLLALVKGGERYVFIYEDSSRDETLRTLGRFASDPDLSFTWYDAAILNQKMGEEAGKPSGQSRFRCSQGDSSIHLDWIENDEPA